MNHHNHNKKCLFPEKEKAIEMVNRVKEKVDDCDIIAVKMMDTTTDFLEDISSSGGKLCFEDYRNLRSQITMLSIRFSDNCSCKKVHGL